MPNEKLNKPLTKVDLKPVFIDKKGPAYSIDQINKICKNSILTENYFFKRVKDMTTDVEKAIEMTENIEKHFSKTLDNFLATEQRFVDSSKKASGNVRDSTQKLADGLAKIEKVANFDRLERYVELLERAAAAMNTLAELDKSGKLSKIAEAIK